MRSFAILLSPVALMAQSPLPPLPTPDEIKAADAAAIKAGRQKPGESSKLAKKASTDTTNQQAQGNLETPTSLFTLPAPKYKLPKDIQNLIMFSVTTDTRREAVLRDEYKTVFKDKKALKAWLNEALDTAIAIWMNAKVDAMEAASRRGDIMAVLKAQSEAGENGSKLINRAKGWQSYAKSDW